MLTFGVLVYDGFDELDAMTPYEVLQLGKRHGANVDACLVRWSEERMVLGQHGVTLNVEQRLGEQNFDWLIVPGGGWAARAASGAWAEFHRGELPKRIQSVNRAGTMMASVCTGAMLLAKAGLTNGRPATTHHCAREELKATGAILIDARGVDDGDIITAAGVTSGLDLGIWLLQRFAGEVVRSNVESSLEYTSIPNVYFGPKGRELSQPGPVHR